MRPAIFSAPFLLKCLAFYLLLCMAAGLQNPVPAENRALSIGVLTDLSGSAAYAGQQLARGAELAAEELRQSSVPISVSIEDHQLKTDRAVSAAQKLLNLEKVDAVFSHFSAPSVAVSPAVHTAGRLFLYSAGAVSILESNPLAFKTFIDFSEGCRRIAQRWKEEGRKKVAVLGPMHEAIDLCRLGAATVFRDLIYQQSDIGAPVNTQILRFKTKKIEALFLPSYEGDLALAFRAAQDQGYFPMFGASADSVSPELKARFAAFMPSVLAFGLPAPPPKFVESFRKRFPSAPSLGMEHAMIGYLGIRELTRALSSCLQGQISCQLSAMAQGAELPEFGFKGWKNRTAVFDIQISAQG